MSLLPSSDILTTVMNFAYIAFFIFSLFFAQRIQGFFMLREISRALTKLKIMRDKAKETAVSAIKEVGKPKRDPSLRLEALMQFFTIEPNTMDPAGAINRLEHVLDVSDERVKNEVRMIAPEANEVQVQNLENLVETVQALNTMYRVVRHYYLMGKRDKTLYATMQIQMQLPQIMEEAEAYLSFLEPYKEGKPVGDGIGALVASRLMANSEKLDVAKDMVAAETYIDGRRVLVTKAKGPGGTVGKAGDALSKLIEDRKGSIRLIVMIDAGLRLEGEESGEVAEGVGAAIGGIGVDKYKIEEAASKYKIPIYAVVVKESIKEVLASMSEAISKSADNVIGTVKRVLQERTKEGDTVIVVGVGNTIGIAQ
jgi:hypothetical protein